jgi:hypothetical protein
MSINRKINLYYGNETHVCREGCVSYGWECSDEDVCVFLRKKHTSATALDLLIEAAYAIGQLLTAFVLYFLDGFSFEIQCTTFWVLDNARIYKTKAIKGRIPYLQKRRLFLVFLTPYLPHLNIVEMLWCKLKKNGLTMSII